MATRCLRSLRAALATCRQEPHFCREYDRCCLQQARSFSTSKVISRQGLPFSAQWRPPFPAHFKPFSAQAAPKDAASSASGEDAAAAKKKRRRKKKNFLEVAQFLPNWGLGARFKKSHWPEGNFYKVTKVKVYKSGIRGAAWGVFHQAEVEKTGEVQKIGGVNKRCWRYVPDIDVSAMVWKRLEAERAIKPVLLTTADT